jgi:hypothetical protein
VGQKLYRRRAAAAALTQLHHSQSTETSALQQGFLFIKKKLNNYAKS